MEIATEVLFSVLPPALGNKTSIALTVYQCRGLT